MTNPPESAETIKHVGYAALCDGRWRTTGVVGRTDLGYQRYKRLGTTERLSGEPRYRICGRCLAILRGTENKTRRLLGMRPLK